MTPRWLRVGLAVAVACGLTGIVEPGAQVRDTTRAAAAQAGTGMLRGQVITYGEDPVPVRRAIVTVTGDGITHGRSTVTDDGGRFVFVSMPAGRFVVTATKAAHLPAAFGANRPGRSPVPIQLAVGEERTDVMVVMARGAAITGALRTPTGEPVADVDVAAFRLPAPGYNLHLAPAGTALSDDRGVYRIYGLSPGDYVIAASVRRRLPGNGDAEAWTVAQVDQTLQHLADPATAPPTGSAPRVSWAPIYFPGTPSPTQAVPIRVRVADNKEGIDLVVSLVRTAKVEGILLGDPDDVRSAQFFFNATGTRLEPLLGETPLFSSRMTDSGKVFTYTGVPPGMFSVTAHLPEGEGRWSRVQFQVDGDDLLDLTMTPMPTLRVQGQVTFEGLDQVPSALLRGATIRAVPGNGIGQAAAGTTRMGNPNIPAVFVRDDGSFEIRGVVPEIVTFAVSTPNAAGWTPQAVMLGGRDVLDVPVAMTEDIPALHVVMTNRPTQVSGRITTGDGTPGASLFITVFPEDPSLWHSRARRITSARADTDGRWVVDGLPPGDYLIVAMTDLVGEELIDAEFLTQLVPSAVRVSLAAGAHQTQDLRIGGR